MSDSLPALPEPHSARSFFCNKCGYFGTDGPDHNWPSGKSSCNYAAVSIGPFYTAEQMRAFRAEGVAAERSLWQEDAERYRWLMMDLGWSVSYRRKPNRPNEYRMRHEGIFWGQWHHSAAAAIDAARKA